MKLVAFLLSLFSLAALACETPLRKEVIELRDDGYTVVWSLSDAALAGAPVTANNLKFQAYLAWVNKHTALDARGLIRNQDQYLRNQIAPGSSLYEYLMNSIEGSRKLLDGEVGKFRRAGCMEILAFEEMLEFVDLTKHDQEFYVHIFAKGSELKVIGNFYHMPFAGAFDSDVSKKMQEQLLSTGWNYLVNFHNHPFTFFRFESPVLFGEEQIGGNVHPSGADVYTFRTRRPREAWITNGIETLVIEERDFDRL